MSVKMEGKTIWIFGLPCSGKTTLAKAILNKYPYFIHLDGDMVRKGINADLGFSLEDRQENLRRMIALAKLLNDQGRHVIASFITPDQTVRNTIQQELDVVLVEAEASLGICMQRDIKGMYKKAFLGIIKDFTGVNQKYDPGLVHSAVLINTGTLTVDESLEAIEMAFNNFQEYIHHHYYFQTSNPLEEHISFIGRWNPFHSGHKYIIQEVMSKHPSKPLLIYVRTTNYDENVINRAETIKKWIITNNLLGTIIIIPDILGVYYGRKVGYEVEQIFVPEQIAEISGTAIRQKQKE